MHWFRVEPGGAWKVFGPRGWVFTTDEVGVGIRLFRFGIRLRVRG